MHGGDSNAVSDRLIDAPRRPFFGHKRVRKRMFQNQELGYT